MKNLKLLFVAVVMTMSTAVLANPKKDFPGGKTSVSYEIGEMLEKSNLIVEGTFTVKIVFTVSEDKTIKIRSIKSGNEEIVQFLMQRLQDQKLSGSSWEEGKIYALPVKVEAVR